MQAGGLVDNPLVGAFCGTSHPPINPGRHVMSILTQHYQLGQKPSQTCEYSMLGASPGARALLKYTIRRQRNNASSRKVSASQRQQVPLPTQPHQPMTEQPRHHETYQPLSGKPNAATAVAVVALGVCHKCRSAYAHFVPPRSKPTKLNST